MTLLETVLADDLAFRAFCGWMTRLVAETTIAGELAWVCTLGLGVTFFTAVEATSIVLSRLSAVASEVALCSRRQQ